MISKFFSSEQGNKCPLIYWKTPLTPLKMGSQNWYCGNFCNEDSANTLAEQEVPAPATVLSSLCTAPPLHPHLPDFKHISQTSDNTQGVQDSFTF